LDEVTLETFFSSDFKISELAIEMIITAIKQQPEESLVNADLISMYIFAKL